MAPGSEGSPLAGGCIDLQIRRNILARGVGKHPVDRLEGTSCVVEQFTVGGMIGGLDALEVLLEPRHVLVDMTHQLELGICRADQQPFRRATQGVDVWSKKFTSSDMCPAPMTPAL